MNISIVNLSKGPFELNEEIRYDGKPLDLKYSVTPRLRYSRTSDYVGFQMDITIMADSVRVLKSGFLIGMNVSGWKEMVGSGVDLTSERGRLSDICQTAWLVATGVVAADTVGSEGLNIILPNINIEKFCDEVLLLPEDADAGQEDG